MLLWPAIKVGQNKKFSSQWMPGWKIKEVISDKNVIITHVDGRRQQLVHVDRLKPYLMPKSTFSSETTTKRNHNTTTPEKGQETDSSRKGRPVSSRVEPKVDTSKNLSQTELENKPRRRAADNSKITKKYPGLQDDVLQFTRSYFGCDRKKNANYNLRQVKRVDYKT